MILRLNKIFTVELYMNAVKMTRQESNYISSYGGDTKITQNFVSMYVSRQHQCGATWQHVRSSLGDQSHI